MKNLFKLWIYILCAFSFFGREIKHDLYDLKFEQVGTSLSSWCPCTLLILGKGTSRLDRDTIVPVSQRPPGVGFRSNILVWGDTIYLPFHTLLSQQIFIPDKSRQIDITFSSQSTNIAKAWLKVSSCNIQEQLLRVDSVALPVTDEWQENTLNIPSENAHFLRIEIGAIGEDIFEAEGWNRESRFRVDQMQVLIDGKELGIKESFRPIPSLSPRAGSYPDQLPDSISRKRIIALGETLHGDSLIVDAELQMIRHLVTKGNCRLIVSEIACDDAFLWNLFIHNSPNVTWEDLRSELPKLQISPDVFKQMLFFLRSHNQTTSPKVYIAGMGPFTRPDHNRLLRVLKPMYNESDSATLLRFAKKLRRDSIQEAVALLGGLDRKSSVDPVNDFLFAELLRQMRKQSKIWKATATMFDSWDAVMAENATFLIDSLSGVLGQTVLWAHWEHLNKINKTTPYMEKSCGAYLKQKYGADYYVIGILRGSGEYLGFLPDHQKRQFTLQKVPLSLPESPLFLENYCNKHFKTNTFYAFSEKERFVCWIREAGVFANNLMQMPVAAAERMDAFLWIK